MASATPLTFERGAPIPRLLEEAAGSAVGKRDEFAPPLLLPDAVAPANRREASRRLKTAECKLSTLRSISSEPSDCAAPPPRWLRRLLAARSFSTSAMVSTIDDAGGCRVVPA